MGIINPPKNNEAKHKAAIITSAAVARPVIEPRIMVMPVTMSAADLSRFPIGSAAHCSGLITLANPLRVILSPANTPCKEIRGSTNACKVCPSIAVHSVSAASVNKFRRVSSIAIPTLSKALASEISFPSRERISVRRASRRSLTWRWASSLR